mgnify:CR=1 FL=1
MIINWNNSQIPVFISWAEVEKVLTVLEHHGLVGDHEWMTVGHGFNSDGEDVDWYSPDTEIKEPEFWQEELWELQVAKRDISYPYTEAQKINQKQGQKRYFGEVKAVEQIKNAIHDWGSELVYDLDFRILEGFFILKELIVVSSMEKGSNDNYEFYVSGDWDIEVDLTKIAPLEE